MAALEVEECRLASVGVGRLLFGALCAFWRHLVVVYRDDGHDLLVGEQVEVAVGQACASRGQKQRLGAVRGYDFWGVAVS